MNHLSTLLVISALTLTGTASLGTHSAQAQTFTVLYTFTGGEDGFRPDAGVTLDRTGTLYGTTAGDGPFQGTVFRLKHTSGNWILNTIDPQENFPTARVVFGPNGSLYGTAQGLSGFPCEFGCGSVYNLKSPCITGGCSWTETTLYGFMGGTDGSNPNGDPVFDQAGNLYGAGENGGAANDGVVFQLTPSGGGWRESVIHSFTGDDGAGPESGVIFDSAGNLYGTTTNGGSSGQGTVFELSPLGSGWNASILYSFQRSTDGGNPVGGLVFDRSGNLYGTTTGGGSGNGGTVFELSPSAGSWTFRVLYSLNAATGVAPQGNLALDAAGNLYGTAPYGGVFRYGTVFKLTPTSGGWTYIRLHNFTGLADGGNPFGGPTLDGSGYLYGTSANGGTGNCFEGCGVVWEIRP